MITLVGLQNSPWNEKARWALDHHRIAYRYEEHLLIFGMPWLRLRLGMPFGEVTVPALIAPDAKLVDSMAIGIHADQIGSAQALFPREHRETIERFNLMSEAFLDAGRALMMDQLRRDREGQADALPAFVPRALRKPLHGIAMLGLKYIDLEFGVTRKSVGEREAAMRKLLLDFRQALSGKDYLAGDRFTFADIALAGALHSALPAADAFLPLPIKASIRRCWTRATLIGEFKDLFEWRDRLYAKHRPKPVGESAALSGPQAPR